MGIFVIYALTYVLFYKYVLVTYNWQTTWWGESIYLIGLGLMIFSGIKLNHRIYKERD